MAFRTRFRRRLARLRAENSGATALEFALVALPFFALMCAIFETTAVFLASISLESAVVDAGRLIRTGQVQSDDMTQLEFKQLICDEVSALLSCDGRLLIDVRSFDEFEDISFPPPLDDDEQVNVDEMFEPGGSEDVVLVRAFYTWSVLTPLIGGTISNMADNQRLIASATAFRNEPF